MDISRAFSQCSIQCILNGHRAVLTLPCKYVLNLVAYTVNIRVAAWAAIQVAKICVDFPSQLNLLLSQ